MSYAELLKDPRWQKKRLEVLNEAGWQCRYCSSGERTLNVHHKRYRAGAKPWEYESDELEVLCEMCHAALTEASRVLKSIVETADAGIIYRLSAYAQALLAKQDPATKPIRVYSTDQVRGAADAFYEAELYGLSIGMDGVHLRSKDGYFDAVEVALEEEAKSIDAFLSANAIPRANG